MTLRNHEPLPLEEFNGLWARGDFDSCPPDHFTDCNNVDYSQSSVNTRTPFTQDFTGNIPMFRQQIFITKVAGVQKVFLMGLSVTGNFYKQLISPVPDANPTLLVSVAGQPIDFDLVNFNGRAYITFSGPSVGTVATNVYLFDGTNFRLAGNSRPAVGAWNIVEGAAGSGNMDVGWHAIAVAFESDSGNVGPVKFFPVLMKSNGGTQLQMTALPLGPAGTVARRIYSSKVVNEFSIPIETVIYFVQRVADNTTTAVNINYLDSQLLEDSTYLVTVFDLIPCGVGIGKYHNRLILYGFPTQTITLFSVGGVPVNVTLTPTTMLVSRVNDPETMDILTGFVIIDPNSSGSLVRADGATFEVGITDAQEYRDLCYCFKFTKTYALTDNGDDPSTWNVTIVDEGSGSFVKGVATVLDSGGVNYEYLIIANITGMYVFNGLFERPEITYNIADLWKTLIKIPGIGGISNIGIYAGGKNHFVLDTINKKIYFLCSFSDPNAPDTLLVGDFSNSSNISGAVVAGNSLAQTIKWSKWTFDNRTFIPYTILGWDISPSFKLIVNDAVGFNNWVLNGTSPTIETIINPFIQTYLIADGNGDVVHVAGIRFRVIGKSNIPTNLTVTLINEDLTRSKICKPLPIIKAMGKEPVLLTNFMSQKFLIKVQVPNGAFFDMNRMTVYVKPVYTSLPG